MQQRNRAGVLTYENATSLRPLNDATGLNLDLFHAGETTYYAESSGIFCTHLSKRVLRLQSFPSQDK